MSATTLDTTRPIFLPDPVNRDHPLNSGRLAWWLGLPGLDGGQTFYDLMGLAHGALSAGPIWQGTSRPGGYSHLLFSGTNLAEVDATPLPRPGSITLSAWVRPDSLASSDIQIIAINREGDGEASGATLFTSVGYFHFYASVTSGSWDVQIGSSAGFTVGQWYHLVGTYDAATGLAALYVNGVLSNFTNSGSASPLAWSSTAGSAWRIGGDDSVTFGHIFQGAIDDVGVIDHAWPPALVAEALGSSSQFYPGGLNRLAAGLLPLQITPVLGASALTAVSTVTAAGLVKELAGAALAAVATVTAGGLVSELGAASLTSVSTVTAGALVKELGASALTAVATVTAGGLVSELGSAALAGLASLTAGGLVSELGAAALASVATVTASGQVGSALSGSAALTSVATVTAGALVKELGAAALASVATLTAGGSVSQLASAALTSVATVTASGLESELASAALAAVSTLTAGGLVSELGAGALQSVATVSAAGSIGGGGGGLTGSAALTSISTLTATGAGPLLGSAFLTCVSTLTASTTNPADDFLDAAQLYAATQPTLVTDFGGRIFKVKATSASVYPYVVLQDDAHLELKTSDTEIHKTTLRFHVYASGGDPQAAASAARVLSDHVEAAFEGRYLQWSSGWASVLVRKDRKHRPTPHKARGAVDVAYLELTFECRTVRE